LLAMGTSCFALVFVRGRKRTPFPPLRISPFILSGYRLETTASHLINRPKDRESGKVATVKGVMFICFFAFKCFFSLFSTK